MKNMLMNSENIFNNGFHGIPSMDSIHEKSTRTSSWIKQWIEFFKNWKCLTWNGWRLKNEIILLEANFLFQPGLPCNLSMSLSAKIIMKAITGLVTSIGLWGFGIGMISSIVCWLQTFLLVFRPLNVLNFSWIFYENLPLLIQLLYLNHCLLW